MKDDEDVAENNSILKLAVQSKYSEEDVALLTKMQISVPMNVQHLKQHVKNIAGLARKCFSQESLLAHSLRGLEDNINYKKMSYVYEFTRDSLFGEDLLGKTHWGMHRFFYSCAMGVKEKMNTTYLDFSELMREIERRKYHCKPPRGHLN